MTSVQQRRKIVAGFAGLFMAHMCGAQAQGAQPPASGQVPELQVTRTVSVTPARERVMLWGNLQTELGYLPGVSLGLSVPLGQAGRVGVSVRGSVDVLAVSLTDGNRSFPLSTVNADLLLSSTGPGLKVYGGPSVGTALGAIWLVGGVAGVRNEFGAGRPGTGRWGYSAEAKARAILVGTEALGVSPGVRLGVTYRF